MKFTRTSLVTKIIILASSAYLGIALMSLSEQLETSEQAREELERKAAEIQRTNDEMTHALANKDDPAVQEQVARDHGYVHKEEQLFIDVAD